MPSRSRGNQLPTGLLSPEVHQYLRDRLHWPPRLSWRWLLSHGVMKCLTSVRNKLQGGIYILGSKNTLGIKHKGTETQRHKGVASRSASIFELRRDAFVSLCFKSVSFS